jgi:Family of unknown function (DUF5343)
VAESALPYLNAYGNISKGLEKIRTAQTPERFTQDFLTTKLNMTGGSATPLIPFLKRIGFIGSDGSPTDLYRQFRGSAADRGAAAAKALRTGYARLYESNEYAHDLNDEDLKSLVVQVTGGSPSSSTVRSAVNSFKALNAFADFEAEADDSEDHSDDDQVDRPDGLPPGIKFGYTINLHLPATSDVAVFNAIFKSLRENLYLK